MQISVWSECVLELTFLCQIVNSILEAVMVIVISNI
jgi:hypothetical protein